MPRSFFAIILAVILRCIIGEKDMEKLIPDPAVIAKEELDKVLNKRPDRIILTISLLTSGTRPELEKCIRSLDHLRQRVPSELLITDTGCDAEHRAFIEKEADRVFDFTWCNDFAAARNVSLFAAQGEWYLYIDDDEWFENTNQIEYFFLSGEYKKHERAGYRQRNYEDFEGKVYNDAVVGRMTAMLPGIHFHGRIHEFLDAEYHDNNECPLMDDFVHHYGYVQGLSGIGQNRQQRNIPMIKAMIEEEPDQERWYYQLLIELIILEQYDEAAVWAQKALDTIDYRKMFIKFYYTFVIAVLNGHLRKVQNDEVNRGNNLMKAFSFLMTVMARAETFEDGAGFYEGKLCLYGAYFAMQADDVDNTKGFIIRYYRSVLKTGIQNAELKRAVIAKKYNKVKKILRTPEEQEELKDMAVYFGSRLITDAFAYNVLDAIQATEDWALGGAKTEVAIPMDDQK